MKIQFTRWESSLGYWYKSKDGRFTIKPTAWASGNPARPIRYQLKDLQRDSTNSCTRLAEAKNLAAQIAELPPEGS